MKIVTWNIEKGKRWQLLEQCLSHSSIRNADILCLNEVDEGMARSGNRRIAYEIGDRLGMQVVFGQTFKELTKGFGDELRSPGENTTAIQGNAMGAHGIRPDYHVEYSIDDVLAGKDRAMETALRLASEPPGGR